MKQISEKVKQSRTARVLTIITMIVLAVITVPFTAGAIATEQQAETTAAQVRQDIKKGYYTQSEYDCDFDDCSDDDIYLASAQKAVVDYANKSLALIKERWERAQ